MSIGFDDKEVLDDLNRSDFQTGPGSKRAQ